MLAEALQTDLIYRLELLHEAGAPKLILAATLLDLALQLIRAEQGAGADGAELCEQLLRGLTIRKPSVASTPARPSQRKVTPAGRVRRVGPRQPPLSNRPGGMR